MINPDLKDRRLIYFKAWLFAAIVLCSCCLLWLQNPTWTTVFLIGVALWSACRLYYFVFYCIHHYVDPSFRYAGIWSMLCWLAKRR